MNRPPKSVSTTLILIILNAAFWLIYAFIMAFGGIPSIAVSGMVKWVMTILAIGSSAALAGIAIFLRKRNRFAFYFGLIILATLAILSITDEFGLLDLFSLLISLIPLGLMLKTELGTFSYKVSGKSESHLKLAPADGRSAPDRRDAARNSHFHSPASLAKSARR